MLVRFDYLGIGIMEYEHKSIGRIILVLLYAGVVGSCLAGAISFFPLGLALPFTVFAHFMYGAPLYPIAFLVNLYIDRKGYASKRNVICCGVATATAYAVIYSYVKGLYPNLFLAFILTGFFASWVYWNELYEDKRWFRGF